MVSLLANIAVDSTLVRERVLEEVLLAIDRCERSWGDGKRGCEGARDDVVRGRVWMCANVECEDRRRRSICSRS